MPSLQKLKALSVLGILEQTYPDAHCALIYATPWQLLAATILSAQCTDVRVNQVTENLFSAYPGPEETATAEIGAIEVLIRSTGFFRNKAKSLVGCARELVAKHGGQVPKTMEELVVLPGVGRKTANVVLGNAFNLPGMVVDTHVGRIATRLGWTAAGGADAIERDLCRLLPKERWTQTSHVLIFHGRQCCRAQIPNCSECPVAMDCPKAGVQRSR